MRNGKSSEAGRQRSEGVESGKRFRYSLNSRYESFAPRSYRSGKNCGGVCVPDCGIAAVDADVGVGVDVARNGVLYGKHMRGAWARKDELACKDRSGMRTLARRRDGSLQHVLLPRGRRIAGGK